ncbi:SprT-like domain-containing protein [Inquilinus sp. NPDC058860]|uniref:SprT-like domain-containing protein n=1 Tax=Inquilinus sp. NPDC058860 TaxID=3346652 RepID=UPI00368CA8D0
MTGHLAGHSLKSALPLRFVASYAPKMVRTMQSNLTPTAETYEGLQGAYDHFNAKLFDGLLPGALITLQREKIAFGFFSAEAFANHGHDRRADEIAMNPRWFGIRPVKVTLSTLVHEMVHQWQANFGRPGRGRYHNKEWADRMERIGLMPSATGKPGGPRTGDQMTHYIVEAGPYCQAADELLTKRFTLSWYDRFPPPTYLQMMPAPIGVDLATLGVVDGEGEAAQPKPIRDRRKSKYRCPQCEAQVWGKPNLKLVCGDCRVDFEVAELGRQVELGA